MILESGPPSILVIRAQECIAVRILRGENTWRSHTVHLICHGGSVSSGGTCAALSWYRRSWRSWAIGRKRPSAVTRLTQPHRLPPQPHSPSSTRLKKYLQRQIAPAIGSMASSSSSSQRQPPEEMLPLIPCPYCKDEILTFVCGPTGSRPGKRFYKCIWKDCGKCKFYEWQEGYARYLAADPGPLAGQSQIREVARAHPAPGGDQHVAAILGMVKDLLRLNLLVAATNLMATALLLAIFIAVGALIFISRSGSD